MVHEAIFDPTQVIVEVFNILHRGRKHGGRDPCTIWGGVGHNWLNFITHTNVNLLSSCDILPKSAPGIYSLMHSPLSQLFTFGVHSRILFPLM